MVHWCGSGANKQQQEGGSKAAGTAVDVIDQATVARAGIWVAGSFNAEVSDRYGGNMNKHSGGRQQGQLLVARHDSGFRL
ncbi:hypothetical protein DVH24_032522 [Malus domestica]|uniref:Uncharacterized protein n=1 Tax=Malus domestica TaxID=3750 RepID=A0A498J602_MALDO|nr:hypothetical protein DVH24_032522 [Malus domestica]